MSIIPFFKLIYKQVFGLKLFSRKYIFKYHYYNSQTSTNIINLYTTLLSYTYQYLHAKWFI